MSAKGQGAGRGRGRGRGERTSKDGDDCFMDGGDFALLHRVAGEKGHDEQHDGDEESP